MMAAIARRTLHPRGADRSYWRVAARTAPPARSSRPFGLEESFQLTASWNGCQR
jgi:hypothetical protein